MATRHFTDRELGCRDGCGGLPSEEFQAELAHLRRVYGGPIPLGSGYRCPRPNQKVSSTGPDGPHTIGAVDLGGHLKPGHTWTPQTRPYVDT